MRTPVFDVRDGHATGANNRDTQRCQAVRQLMEYQPPHRCCRDGLQIKEGRQQRCFRVFVRTVDEVMAYRTGYTG